MFGAKKHALLLHNLDHKLQEHFVIVSSTATPAVHVNSRSQVESLFDVWAEDRVYFY